MSKQTRILLSTMVVLCLIIGSSSAHASTPTTVGDELTQYQTGVPGQGEGDQVQTAAKDSTQSPLTSFFNGMMDWLYSPEPVNNRQKSSSSSQNSTQQRKS